MEKNQNEQTTVHSKKESQKKSIVKTISWRVVATLTTMTLAYLFIGDVTIALEIGFFEVILKMIFYYVHERVWSRMG
jgi:uncharacterized membrane protein